MNDLKKERYLCP